MLDRAKVLSVSQDGTVIEIKKNDACPSCKRCAFGDGGTVTYTVANYPGAEVGDAVIVDMAEKSLFSSVLLFLLPLAALIIGFLIGYFASGKTEWIGFVAGGAPMVMAFVALFFLDKKLGKRKDFIPVIKELYKGNNGE